MTSSAMRRLDRTLRQVAEKAVAICLVGESGTGKEILARRVHELSRRPTDRFVPINCAAIPETLFESELFGHERGAFTGASELARGKVEAASGGTLFLDEIGELPLAMQAKLLRFLEGGRFMRVGGTKKLQADVRLVSATLRPLEEDVRRGTFRADLYYRIQGITLAIPPLRERRADIPALIAELTAQLSAKHDVKSPRLGRSAARALCQYAWPGNIRELRNVVEQLCLLRGGRPVRPIDLPPAIAAAARGDGAAKASPARVLEIDLADPLDLSIDRILEAAVSLEGGNRSRAAARLGVGLRTLQRRLGPQTSARRRRAPAG
jgi:transcriptional regulator with PAS, ATPase and Fis domain